MLRLALLLLLAVRLPGADCDDSGIRILEERTGDGVRLFVQSDNSVDITITLSPELKNLRATTALPVTAESQGRSRFLLAEFKVANPREAWSYRYTHKSEYGSRGGSPDDTAYLLPFAGSHRLSQGYGGSHSHQAGTRNEHAHDWTMPEGTVVLAARAGHVVGVRQDSTAGGPNPAFLNCANFVLIRHADGTYAEYVHLKAGGVRVRIGDQVQAGQPIALSGNTGWTTQPHLHFAVFHTVGSRIGVNARPDHRQGV